MSGFDRGDRFERLQSDLLRARAKIRELEAEVDTLRLMVRGRDVNLAQHVARAEKAETRLAKARFTQSELAYLHNGLHETSGERWLFDSCPDKVCTTLRERVKASDREASK